MIGSLCSNLLHRERIQKLEGNLKEKKKEKTFIFLCDGFPFAMDESIIEYNNTRQGSYCLEKLVPRSSDLNADNISHVNALTKSNFFKFMSYKSANLTDLFADNLAID